MHFGPIPKYNQLVSDQGNHSLIVLFTQYDTRIWPEVYHVATEESREEDPKNDKTEDEKYPQALDQDGSPLKVDPDDKKLVPVKRVIKRRYREFMELHHRLCTGIHKEEMKG